MHWPPGLEVRLPVVEPLPLPQVLLVLLLQLVAVLHLEVLEAHCRPDLEVLLVELLLPQALVERPSVLLLPLAFRDGQVSGRKPVSTACRTSRLQAISG